MNVVKILHQLPTVLSTGTLSAIAGPDSVYELRLSNTESAPCRFEVPVSIRLGRIRGSGPELDGSVPMTFYDDPDR